MLSPFKSCVRDNNHPAQIQGERQDLGHFFPQRIFFRSDQKVLEVSAQGLDKLV